MRRADVRTSNRIQNFLCTGKPQGQLPKKRFCWSKGKPRLKFRNKFQNSFDRKWTGKENFSWNQMQNLIFYVCFLYRFVGKTPYHNLWDFMLRTVTAKDTMSDTNIFHHASLSRSQVLLTVRNKEIEREENKVIHIECLWRHINAHKTRKISFNDTVYSKNS